MYLFFFFFFQTKVKLQRVRLMAEIFGCDPGMTFQKLTLSQSSLLFKFIKTCERDDF